MQTIYKITQTSSKNKEIITKTLFSTSLRYGVASLPPTNSQIFSVTSFAWNCFLHRQSSNHGDSKQNGVFKWAGTALSRSTFHRSSISLSLSRSQPHVAYSCFSSFTSRSELLQCRMSKQRQKIPSLLAWY